MQIDTTAREETYIKWDENKWKNWLSQDKYQREKQRYIQWWEELQCKIQNIHFGPIESIIILDSKRTFFNHIKQQDDWIVQSTSWIIHEYCIRRDITYKQGMNFQQIPLWYIVLNTLPIKSKKDIQEFLIEQYTCWMDREIGEVYRRPISWLESMYIIIIKL